MPVKPPSPPYVGPPKFHGGNNRPIERIVIHCTAGAEPGVQGAARSTAAYTKNTSRPSSWHYCADSRESVQLTYDSVVAYHDGTNDRSIGYELSCSLSNEGGVITRAKTGAKALTHWQTPAHRAMLKIAAEDCARLALANNIPIRRLSVAEVRADRKGFCGHVEMRDAFPGRTSHWDPGPFFPWRYFMRLVRQAAARLTAEPKPKPKPVKRKGISIGTHNLHDDAGVPTLFADILFFTEAIAPTIRARVKARIARTKVELAGYRVVRADENKTVVIAVKRRLFKVTGKEWHRAHGGKAGLTPARGTLLVRGVMRETGQHVSLLAEHRINDSWKTSARELPFRKSCWRQHTDLTKRLAKAEVAAGRTVFAGGDMNTRWNMSAYEGVLEESGKHLDRLGVSPDMHISKAEVLSRRGSDHPRVRATVTPKG